jgi:TorA maturation chaperone TorD
MSTPLEVDARAGPSCGGLSELADPLGHVEEAIVLYARAASLLLEPDDGAGATLEAAEAGGEIMRAARAVAADTGAPAARAAARVVEAAETLAAAIRADELGGTEGPARLRALFFGTFGHALSPDHPLYETQYGDDPVFRQPQRLADVSGFYRAFGVDVAPDAHERVDHVGVELEFLALLTAREATARAAGEPDRARTCGLAIEVFLREHLAPVLPTFARLLGDHARDRFYPAAARLAEAVCSWDCARRGVEAAADDRARLVRVIEPDPEEVDA